MTSRWWIGTSAENTKKLAVQKRSPPSNKEGRIWKFQVFVNFKLINIHGKKNNTKRFLPHIKFHVV